MAPRLLVRANMMDGRGTKVGVLTGNGIRGGLAIGTRGFSSTTGRTVRTTNNRARIVWYFERSPVLYI